MDDASQISTKKSVGSSGGFSQRCTVLVVMHAGITRTAATGPQCALTWMQYEHVSRLRRCMKQSINITTYWYTRYLTTRRLKSISGHNFLRHFGIFKHYRCISRSVKNGQTGKKKSNFAGRSLQHTITEDHIE